MLHHSHVFISWQEISIYSRNICPKVFCNKGVLKGLSKFTGKHDCRRRFLNKTAGLLSCEFWEIVKNTYFVEHLPSTASVILILKGMSLYRKLTPWCRRSALLDWQSNSNTETKPYSRLYHFYGKYFNGRVGEINEKLIKLSSMTRLNLKGRTRSGRWALCNPLNLFQIMLPEADLGLLQHPRWSALW